MEFRLLQGVVIRASGRNPSLIPAAVTARAHAMSAAIGTSLGDQKVRRFIRAARRHQQFARHSDALLPSHCDLAGRFEPVDVSSLRDCGRAV